MTTIHTLKDALALADHNGHLVVDGDLQIACTLGYKPWSNEDATGLTIRARNIHSAGGGNRLAVHEIHADGHIIGFEAVSAQHIRALHVSTPYLHVKHIKADRVECEEIYAHLEPEVRELSAFVRYMEMQQPRTSVADIVNQQYKDMPVFSRRSFI